MREESPFQRFQYKAFRCSRCGASATYEERDLPREPYNRRECVHFWVDAHAYDETLRARHKNHGIYFYRMAREENSLSPANFPDMKCSMIAVSTSHRCPHGHFQALGIFTTIKNGEPERLLASLHYSAQDIDADLVILAAAEAIARNGALYALAVQMWESGSNAEFRLHE